MKRNIKIEFVSSYKLDDTESFYEIEYTFENGKQLTIVNFNTNHPFVKKFVMQLSSDLQMMYAQSLVCQDNILMNLLCDMLSDNDCGEFFDKFYPYNGSGMWEYMSVYK